MSAGDTLHIRSVDTETENKVLRLDFLSFVSGE